MNELNQQIAKIWLIWFFTRALDVCKVGLAALGISASPDTPERMASLSLAVAFTVAHWAVSFYNTRKAVTTPTGNTPTVGGGSKDSIPSVAPLILIGFILASAFTLTGCETTNPNPSVVTNSDGSTETLSANDQKALQSVNAVESNLTIIRAGTAGAVELAFTIDPKLGSEVGPQMWGVSHGTYTLATGTLVTPDQLVSSATTFTNSNSTAATVKTVGNALQTVKSLYTVYYQKLVAAQNTSSSTYVRSQIAKASVDLLSAIAGGVSDATTQYAPTPTGKVAQVFEWICYYVIRPRAGLLT